jgi:hypothetical protein
MNAMGKRTATAPTVELTGTPGQIDWALQIRPQVDAEFDRVAQAFRAVASQQPDAEREATLAIVAILEEKRTEVMARRDAGYYLREWRELHDQVRQLIFADRRYQVLKSNRPVKDNAK